MDIDTKEFIREEIGVLCRAFGITGTALGAGSIQPGAMEVLADAISQGNFVGGRGLGASIEYAADRLAEAVEELASAVLKLNPKGPATSNAEVGGLAKKIREQREKAEAKDI
jgi:hypothetical protein